MHARQDAPRRVGVDDVPMGREPVIVPKVIRHAHFSLPVSAFPPFACPGPIAFPRDEISQLQARLTIWHYKRGPGWRVPLSSEQRIGLQSRDARRCYFIHTHALRRRDAGDLLRQRLLTVLAVPGASWDSAGTFGSATA